jgi:hypothetical protein
MPGAPSTADRPPAKRSSGRWITIVQIILLATALALSAYVATQAFKPKPIARPPRFAPGAARGGRGLRAERAHGMPPLDRKIVRDFDKNGDSRRDRAERDAAWQEVARAASWRPRCRSVSIQVAQDQIMNFDRGDPC